VEDFARFLEAEYPLVESSTFYPIGPTSASFKLALQREANQKDFAISLKLVERYSTELVYFTVKLCLLDKAGADHRISEGMQLHVLMISFFQNSPLRSIPKQKTINS
jgi:hypothetical protein